MSNGSPDGSKTIMSSSAEALFPFARVNCEKADEGEGRVELSSPRFQIITFDLREQVMKRGGKEMIDSGKWSRIEALVYCILQLLLATY